MAVLLIAFETHHGDVTSFCEVRQLRHLGHRSGRIEQSSIDGATGLDVVAAERRPVLLRISQRTEMAILDACGVERLAQRGLAEPTTSAHRVQAHVDEYVDVAPSEVGDELIDVAALVSD